jgi:hypothetical protein
MALKNAADDSGIFRRLYDLDGAKIRRYYDITKLFQLKVVIERKFYAYFVVL